MQADSAAFVECDDLAGEVYGVCACVCMRVCVNMRVYVYMRVYV